MEPLHEDSKKKLQVNICNEQRRPKISICSLRWNMSWTKSKYIFLYMVGTSLTLLLFIDFFVGGYMLPCEKRTHLTFSRCSNEARIAHPIYHHDLSKNYKGIESWGPLKYSLCTDINGFKVACNANDALSKYFDIAFIGDSFTEGIGLNYEDTFVGQISSKRPELKIANLGVTSYSPSIYLSKVKFLLEQGITFKELIVYIDISDIQDEAVNYTISNGVVISKTVSESIAPEFFTPLKQFLNWAFPLTYFGLQTLKAYFSNVSDDKTQNVSYLAADYDRSAWTYNSSSKGYGSHGVMGGVQQSLQAMAELSDLLKDNGIKLSVGIYPWPGQLLYDVKDSAQVRIWKDFCRSRCLNFYNSFDSFFSLKDEMPESKLIEQYFIEGDIHHNRLGAEVIANNFLKSYRN